MIIVCWQVRIVFAGEQYNVVVVVAAGFVVGMTWSQGEPRFRKPVYFGLINLFCSLHSLVANQLGPAINFEPTVVDNADDGDGDLTKANLYNDELAPYFRATRSHAAKPNAWPSARERATNALARIEQRTRCASNARNWLALATALRWRREHVHD